MKYFIYQGNEHDCGFASLKMLLAILTKDKSYLYISKPDKKGNFTIDDLLKIAKSFNLILQSFKCDKDYINHLTIPSLALLKGNHLVLIKKRTKNRILIYDPGRGKIWYKKNQFESVFLNIVIEVENADYIQKINLLKKRILPTKMHVIQTIISFISTATLITSFYFLNGTKNFIYSLIFICLFLISQFIENLYVYKQINYFDEKYIFRYFDNNEINEKNYIDFLSFKQNYFVSNRGILSSVLLAFVITFFLCLNDFRNVLALLIIILVKVFDFIVFSKSNKKEENKIEKLEKDGLNKNNENANSLYYANLESNKKVFKDSIKNLFYLIICFSLAIGMMIFSKVYTCNFVIFHFLIYFVSYKTYSDLLGSISNKNKNFKDECQFIDKCNL